MVEGRLVVESADALHNLQVTIQLLAENRPPTVVLYCGLSRINWICILLEELVIRTMFNT